MFGLRLLGAEVFVWQVWLPVFSWFAGGLLGYLVLVLDRLVDIYVTHPDTKLSVFIQDTVNCKQYRKAWQVLQANRHLQLHLVFHSALFQIIWVFLALFTITSTFQLFGKGFILGLGLHLLLEEWEAYAKNKETLKQWLFWQVNVPVSDKQLKQYLLIMTGLTAIFFLMVLYR